jgi:hypothetical protein
MNKMKSDLKLPLSMVFYHESEKQISPKADDFSVSTLMWRTCTPESINYLDGINISRMCIHLECDIRRFDL